MINFFFLNNGITVFSLPAGISLLHWLLIHSNPNQELGNLLSISLQLP